MEHALIPDARRVFAGDFLGWNEVSPLIDGDPLGDVDSEARRPRAIAVRK